MDKKHEDLIVDILTSAGLLTKKQVREALSKESQSRARISKSKSDPKRGSHPPQSDISIIEIIQSQKFKVPGGKEKTISEEAIMEEVARHFRMPYLKIDPLKLDSEVVTKTISKPYALKHQLIPVERNGHVLTVAISNPFEQEGIEGIKRSIGYEVETVISTKTDILKIIMEFYGFRTSVAAAEEEYSAHLDLGDLEQYVKLKSISELDATDQHIIKAVEYLLHYAYAQRVSDIHIEPKRNYSQVRFRIDGILHTVNKMPKNIHNSFISRIKTMARMNITEKRKPQDGRIKTDHGGKEFEIRVSTLPVSFGEKCVMRIFDPTIVMQEIDELGFMEKEIKLFKSFISAPYGLILVTGPTGSGKTTTLYSALKSLSSPRVNITTIEDPVEMISEQFNQTSVQQQIGVTFASSLRTILRQDPDIIMVGEIRDLETAENALQAALTGHLVLSTLHTNDAPSSIARLLDIGLPPFLINSTLIGVVAQRLVRIICKHCSEAYQPPKEELKMMALDKDISRGRPFYRGKGCVQCRGTGFLGRTGIFEVLEISERVKKAVEDKSNQGKIKEIATEEGFITLRECAIDKLFQGVTAFEEIVRVTGAV